jgi:hypothetical protein
MITRLTNGSISVVLIASLIGLGSSWQPARNCGHGTAPISGQPSKSSCESWRSMVSKLSEREKRILATEGAVYTGNLILGKDMISNCELRGGMSIYFGKVLRGEADEFTKVFASSHSVQIVRVVRLLWPSLCHCNALVGDGNFNAEKYNLLGDAALQSEVVAPLVASIITRERVGGDLAFVLFSRPMRELRRGLIARLGKAQKAGDIRQQIYVLAVLHSLGDTSVLKGFKTLSKSRRLSTYEAKLIVTLEVKIREGKNLSFADVEDLEYLNNR